MSLGEVAGNERAGEVGGGRHGDVLSPRVCLRRLLEAGGKAQRDQSNRQQFQAEPAQRGAWRLDGKHAQRGLTPSRIRDCRLLSVSSKNAGTTREIGRASCREKV